MAKKKKEEEALRSQRLEEEVAQLRRQIELLLQSQQQQQQQKTSGAVPAVAKPEVKPPNDDIRECLSGESSESESAAKSANSMVRELWNGTLANATTEDKFDDKLVDNNVNQNKEKFIIFHDSTIVSKGDDKRRKSRISTGFIDNTIALPKSETLVLREDQLCLNTDGRQD